MHDFVYLAQRRSQEFSCEPNFEGMGRAPTPLGCASDTCTGLTKSGIESAKSAYPGQQCMYRLPIRPFSKHQRMLPVDKQLTGVFHTYAARNRIS